MLSSLYESLSESLLIFLEPNTRVYYPFLMSTLILGGGFFVWTKGNANPQTVRAVFKYLFPKSIWWHRSARVDYQLLLFNNMLKALLIVPYTISHIQLMWVVVQIWREGLGWSEPLTILSPVSVSILYTAIMLLVGDFSRFLWHYAMHKIPILWKFHQVHHAAEVMTPLTLYRIHPVEYFFNRLRGLVVFGIVAGTFYYWFQSSITAITIFQIHIGLFVFNIMGANLRHSHIPISFGKRLEHLFISPAQHQIHHSQAEKHYDKNFGSVFAIWDWFFGSLWLTNKTEKISFGIEKKEQNKYQSFFQNLWSPIQSLGNYIIFWRR